MSLYQRRRKDERMVAGEMKGQSEETRDEGRNETICDVVTGAWPVVMKEGALRARGVKLEGTTYRHPVGPCH